MSVDSGGYLLSREALYSSELSVIDDGDLAPQTPSFRSSRQLSDQASLYYNKILSKKHFSNCEKGLRLSRLNLAEKVVSFFLTEHRVGGLSQW